MECIYDASLLRQETSATALNCPANFLTGPIPKLRKEKTVTTRVLVGAICLPIFFTGVSAFAAMLTMDPTLDMGAVLPNYAIVSVGPTASLMVNSGPITGKVLIGDSSTATSAGGGNGQVTGGLDISPVASGDQLQNLQPPQPSMSSHQLMAQPRFRTRIRCRPRRQH